MSSIFESCVAIVCLLFTSFLSAEFLICSAAASNGCCLAAERKALLRFKNGLSDPKNILSSWQGCDCCQWRGITCDNQTGVVIGIDLSNASPNGFWNLSGIIDPSLLQLKSLRFLDLSSNTFGGIPIPEFIGSLKPLTYLNLSFAGFSGTIPAQLGNLSRLEFLDLSSNFPPLMVDDFQWISGLISLTHLEMDGVDLSLIGSQWVHSINRLSTLTELHLQDCALSGITQSLPFVNFTKLAVLDLSLNNFNSTIPSWLFNLSSLVHVDMNSAGLRGAIPVKLSSNLPKLRYLDLSMNNNLTADCSILLSGDWRRIEYIDLATNQIYGELPASIGNFTSLVELNFFSNMIEGGIPSSIGKLCNLKTLNLAGNNLTLGLPSSIEQTTDCTSENPLPTLTKLIFGNNQIMGGLPAWLGELRNLQVLDLSYNSIQGPIPTSLGNLSALTELGLAGNNLNGTLPPTLGQLSKLIRFDVSGSHLTGIVSETHFSKLTDLKNLILSTNSLVINVSSNWIPPFQVRGLEMGSCLIGSQFPSWLETQNELRYLDLSNASISGMIPTWFWELSSNLSLLNISFNQIEGQLPNPLPILSYADVDMRSNLFTGPLPLPSDVVELLDLSNNQFSDIIPPNIGDLQPYLIYLSLSRNNLSGEIPTSIGEIQGLQALVLSGNKLTGNIPESLQNLMYLKALGLEYNLLSGPIPASLGSLRQLQSLHLSNNQLSGMIPLSLKNCSSLETLDLGNNSLDGYIPTWLGWSLPKLRILRLRSNMFYGQIPPQLSNLSSLQVLDLAFNNLEGSIPWSFGDFKGMTSTQMVNQYLFRGFYRGHYYEDHLTVHFSNNDQLYTKTLSLVTSIDLSRNKLSGQFPDALTKLVGLLFLDLSNNNLIGGIPEDITAMQSLLSLDLSNNGFSGGIPSVMTAMSSVGYLDLSNNNFSGRIPTEGQFSTFDVSSFTGNVYLCGTPLALQCQQNDGENTNRHDGADDYEDNDDDEVFEDKWFLLSMGIGFAVGLLGLFAVISIRKQWSAAYFNAVDQFICATSHLKHVIPWAIKGRRKPTTSKN